MAGARVIFDRQREYVLTVEGHGELRFEEDSVLGSMEVAGPASLTSFRHALTRHLRYLDLEPPYQDVLIRLSLTPESHYDHDYSAVDSVGLRRADGRWLVQVEMVVEHEPNFDAVEQLLAPMLARERAELVGFDSEDLVAMAFAQGVQAVQLPSARSTRGGVNVIVQRSSALASLIEQAIEFRRL
jgi:hypothetical protein